MSEPSPYSVPRYAPTKYTVYPRGYDESPFTDTHHFCVYVEQFPDTGKWRIHDGFENRLATHKGNWVNRNNLTRQWTRFDTAEDALKAALIAVENLRPPGWTLIDMAENFRKQQAAKELTASEK